MWTSFKQGDKRSVTQIFFMIFTKVIEVCLILATLKSLNKFKNNMIEIKINMIFFHYFVIKLKFNLQLILYFS